MMMKRYNPCRPLPTRSNHNNLLPTVYVDVDVRRSGPMSKWEEDEEEKTPKRQIVNHKDQPKLAASQWGSAAQHAKSWLKSWYYPSEIFDPWPSKAPDGVRCWWCTHTFDTPPFPMPYHHDKKIDRYKVRGMFCGPSCAKAYARHSYTYTDGTVVNVMHWIEVIAKKYYGFSGTAKIPQAPPRELLREYCGPNGFTIEQFRTVCAYSRTVRALPSKFITEKQIIEAEQTTAQQMTRGTAYHPENPDKIRTTQELVVQARKPYVGKGAKRLNEFFGRKRGTPSSKT